MLPVMTPDRCAVVKSPRKGFVHLSSLMGNGPAKILHTRPAPPRVSEVRKHGEPGYSVAL